jgi:hypothetical protein
MMPLWVYSLQHMRHKLLMMQGDVGVLSQRDDGIIFCLTARTE